MGSCFSLTRNNCNANFTKLGSSINPRYKLNSFSIICGLVFLTSSFPLHSQWRSSSTCTLLPQPLKLAPPTPKWALEFRQLLVVLDESRNKNIRNGSYFLKTFRLDLLSTYVDSYNLMQQRTFIYPTIFTICTHLDNRCTIIIGTLW